MSLSGKFTEGGRLPSCRSAASEPHQALRDGDEIGVPTFRGEIELHDRLAAARQLGRVLGIVSGKREYRGNVGLLDTRNMSEAELKRLAHAVAPDDGFLAEGGDGDEQHS